MEESRSSLQLGHTMEDALEAAATLISYIGETVIKSKCSELLSLAKDVEQAAESVGLQHEDLSRLSDELKRTDERDKNTLTAVAAVVNLGYASAAIERIADAPFLALRDSLVSLARECRDLRDAYQSIESLRRAKVERVQHSTDRPPLSGLLSFWGRFGSQQGIRENLLVDVEKARQSKDLEGSLAVTVDLLLTEGRLLKEKGAKLVDQARDVTITANGAGVHYLCVELLRAMDAMEQADESHTLRCVMELEAAATSMEGTVKTSRNVLRDRAAELLCACVELKRAHDAMVTVQQAAAEQREARIAGAVAMHREGGVARVAAASGLGEQPDLGQGESKRSAMTAYALYGSVSLITYLGPDNVTKSMKGLTQCLKKSFHVAFSLWWTLQAVGVPLSAYARSLTELQCYQVLCRLGVLGINLLVIVFLYLALDMDSSTTLKYLVGSASVLHLLSLGLVCWRGDLSKA